MKLKALFLATLFALPAQAVDFDLTDLVPARPGQATTAPGVQTTENIVVGDTTEAAMSVAHAVLINEDTDGVQYIQVGSGTGILSMGTAFYSTYENINATLLSKRAAYNQAYLIAKQQLIENMKGSEQSCGTLAAISTDMIDTGADSVANTKNEMFENCLTSVRGSLSGFVTYDVYDDVDTKKVRVSLISTPKTRSMVMDSAGALTATSDPSSIFRTVISDLREGVLPPVGAKILSNPETGETIIIGFGSAIKRENSNPRVQANLARAANQQAEARARSALIATVQGSDVYWQGSFEESQIESTQQFEYKDPLLEDPNTASRLRREKEQFLSHMQQSDEYRTITAGQLPPGVALRSFDSVDGHWRYTVAVYSPTLEGIARDANAQMEAQQRGEGGPAGQLRQVGPDGKAANPQGASGRVTEREGI